MNRHIHLDLPGPRSTTGHWLQSSIVDTISPQKKNTKQEFKELQEFKERSQEPESGSQHEWAWRGARLRPVVKTPTSPLRLGSWRLRWAGHFNACLKIELQFAEGTFWPRGVRTGGSRERPRVWLLYRPIRPINRYPMHSIPLPDSEARKDGKDLLVMVCSEECREAVSAAMYEEWGMDP